MKRRRMYLLRSEEVQAIEDRKGKYFFSPKTLKAFGGRMQGITKASAKTGVFTTIHSAARPAEGRVYEAVIFDVRSGEVTERGGYTTKPEAEKQAREYQAMIDGI